MRSRSSKTDPLSASALPEFVLVGLVVRPHGVRGDLLIEETSDVRGRFDPGSKLWLTPMAGARRRVQVASARRTPRGTRLRLSGIEDRETAECLRGARLEVPRCEVPPAPLGSYYFFELVGCRCVDEEAGELGEVAEVVESGAGLLLRVARSGGGGVLIPYVEDFLKRVDVASRRIELKLPEGLLETCAFKS